MCSQKAYNQNIPKKGKSLLLPNMTDGIFSGEKLRFSLNKQVKKPVALKIALLAENIKGDVFMYLPYKNSHLSIFRIFSFQPWTAI